MIEQVKCINCKHLRLDGWCEQIADSPHEGLDRRCDFFQTATNGDRIRRMKDEELAAFLCNISTIHDGEWCDPCIASSHCRPGHNGFLDWLKEEHNG